MMAAAPPPPLWCSNQIKLFVLGIIPQKKNSPPVPPVVMTKLDFEIYMSLTLTLYRGWF